ncbi:hybrid sensor histidine kinase/response regulator [Variovorax sp. J22R24]|nr:hybrid sensor histidine kinase/response regulator [Variovorax sp. J22R24]
MSTWFKGRRFYAAIGLLPAIFSVTALLLFWPGGSDWPRSEPREGFYWSAAQYEKAFGRAREELRAIAAGETVRPETLDRVTSVLGSTADRLLAPSKLNDALRTIDGYPAMAEQLARFDQEVVARVHAQDFDAGAARDLLSRFSEVEPVVQDWVEAARSKEMASGDEVLLRMTHTRNMALFAAALLGVGGCIWLLSILGERRAFRMVAQQRLLALEAEKNAKAEMEEAVRAKTQFLSMVSHELRSPLQAILSSVDVLGMAIPPAEREQAIGRIRRSSMVLGVQLRDLLTLARGEAGKLEIRPESFEARALMDDVADVAGERARDKGLTFNLLMPKEPVFAMADVLRISQILANLVSNAIKYTERGHVSLELEPAPLGSSKLVFHVTDTGPGIPSARLATAFEPFERVGAPGKADESAGIGLTIVRTVVKHLGGTVEIDSQEGQGTRVTVRVPALIEDPDAVHGHSDAMDAVLIVEDRGYIRASIHSLATRMGYRCDVADSAAAAANYLAATPYYTVLIDLDMPVRGGIELAMETRRLDGPNQNGYLVAMSAAAPERALVPWPFDQVMEKPIETARFERVLTHRERERQR